MVNGATRGEGFRVWGVCCQCDDVVRVCSTCPFANPSQKSILKRTLDLDGGPIHLGIHWLL